MTSPPEIVPAEMLEFKKLMPKFYSNSSYNTYLIYLLLIAGFLVRLVILLAAENQLEADESTVGIMSLDILEMKAYPIFFYGTAYNGGGAIEAYMGAIAFALFGPSAIALKSCILLLWTITAIFFADFCRRTLTAKKAVVAVLFFCISTPFFLEWSIKARGGFIETVLFSVILLWLSEPPVFLGKKNNVRAVGFGIVSGVGLYASEMLLAMIICAGLWFVYRTSREARWRAVVMLLIGFGIGLMPLIIYNFNHDFMNFKASVLYKVLRQQSGGSGPLSFSHISLTARFILGEAYILLIIGLIVAAFSLIKKHRPLEIGHLILLHTLLYIAAYTVSGPRYLPAPPSRVLYSIYPGLAILLAYAADVPGSSKALKRFMAMGAVVLWLILVSIPVSNWISSKAPREEGSWRGSWSLIDAAGLYEKLVDMGVDAVHASPWTRAQLVFAARSEKYMNDTARNINVHFGILDEPERYGNNIAFVLNSKGELLTEIENILSSRQISYLRSEFKDLTILYGINSEKIYSGAGFPPIISRKDWQPLPEELDGFN